MVSSDANVTFLDVSQSINRFCSLSHARGFCPVVTPNSRLFRYCVRADTLSPLLGIDKLQLQGLDLALLEAHWKVIHPESTRQRLGRCVVRKAHLKLKRRLFDFSDAQLSCLAGNAFAVPHVAAALLLSLTTFSSRLPETADEISSLRRLASGLSSGSSTNM